MSKVSKKAVKKHQAIRRANGQPSKFARAKAVARLGLGSGDSYKSLVNASLEDYLLDTQHPDPRIVWSGIGKRIALFNAEVRAASLLNKGQRKTQDFFLSA